MGNKEERLAIWETTSTVSALTTGAYVWDRIPLYHSVPGKHKNQEETQITTKWLTPLTPLRPYFLLEPQGLVSFILWSNTNSYVFWVTLIQH